MGIYTGRSSDMKPSRGSMVCQPFFFSKKPHEMHFRSADVLVAAK